MSGAVLHHHCLNLIRHTRHGYEKLYKYQASKAKASTSKVDADSESSGPDQRQHISNDGSKTHHTVQDHLSALQHGIQGLIKEQGDLLHKNRKLQDELDLLHNEAGVQVQPKSAKSQGKSNSLLNMKIKELELEVRRLKKAHDSDRKKIRKLRLREARKDAEELHDELLHGVPDIAHVMKKLLRRFYAAVSGPSLGDKEECAVCMDEMELSKCSR
ncbi:hypothetical protein BC834DRAFT_687618 [Gloeopeniophorella convolvens]|nr:hypothetical protein BC834DRAFT_687618 [Gloeopeniophorella convolvens]